MSHWADWWPERWRALPAVGGVGRGEVIARVVGLVRGGLPVARAISRTLSERRYRYAEPADYVALVLDLEREVRWALQAIGILPVPGAVPPPVRILPVVEAEVRREAVRREVRRVLGRETTTGRSAGLSSGPRCRECGGQGTRLVALMEDGSVRPAGSVARGDSRVVDTEWRCSGHVPAVPVVPTPGQVPLAGSVRLVKASGR